MTLRFDSTEDQESLGLLTDHLISNVEGLMERLCKHGDYDCQCFVAVAIHAEHGKGIWMTFKGCIAEETVLIQPPPASWDKRTADEKAGKLVIKVEEAR